MFAARCCEELLDGVFVEGAPRASIASPAERRDEELRETGAERRPVDRTAEHGRCLNAITATGTMRRTARTFMEVASRQIGPVALGGQGEVTLRSKRSHIVRCCRKRRGGSRRPTPQRGAIDVKISLYDYLHAVPLGASRGPSFAASDGAIEAVAASMGAQTTQEKEVTCRVKR